MLQRSILSLALSGGFLLVGMCLGTAAAAEPAAHDAPRSALDEVIVSAEQEKPRRLLMAIEQSEDRFFAAYNRVNTKPEYRIQCNAEAPTGSFIRVRECNPQYVDAATQAEARDYFDAYNTPGAAWTPGLGAMLIAARNPEFERHLVAVIKANPHLVKLLRERAALVQRYEAARKRKSRGR